MPAERDMKILVVDDFAATRKILINTLAQLGYNNTDEADDGYSALVKLKSAIFDFVVLEWNMSKMSGMELLEQIRAVPNLKQIPVLMVTEDVLQENIVAAVKAGLNAYVIKPVEVNNFAKIIEKIFSQLKIILSKKGSIFFEIDPNKAGKIKKILETEGFKQITFLKDLLNKKRAVFAK